MQILYSKGVVEGLISLNQFVALTSTNHAKMYELYPKKGSIAPGFDADSSADPNRLHQSRNPAYVWLVWNAKRFGFTNYAFEPWHWEWTGEAPRTP